MPHIVDVMRRNETDHIKKKEIKINVFERWLNLILCQQPRST